MGAEQSKLLLRKTVLTLTQKESIPPSDTEFWQQFYRLPTSAEDVFNFFPPKDVRKLRDEYTENCQTLLVIVMEKISEIVKQSQDFDATVLSDVLNCLRILTRFLPYIFELDSQSEIGQKFHTLFWKHKDGGECRASVLVRNVVELLFYRGFTLPEITSDKPGVHYVIWFKGIGTDQTPPESLAINNNRAEVLRIVLTLLSNQLYVPPHEVLLFENRWLHLFAFEATCLEKRSVMAILCSLVNTVTYYDPVGFGIPYNHVCPR